MSASSVPKMDGVSRSHIPSQVALRSDSNMNQSKDTLLHQIRYALANATEERVLIFETVPIETAHSTATELDRLAEGKYRLSYNSFLGTLKVVVMPNLIHDCHQPWLISSLTRFMTTGFLTLPELESLNIYSGSTFARFLPPYASSRKEPDQCILPEGLDLPTVVVECGWSGSRKRLHDDRDLWLFGGQPFVQIVLIIKWSKNVAGHVSGDVEVFENDPVAGVRCIQSEIIFPTPSPHIANAQGIRITRRQLFGPNLPAGQVPNQSAHLSVNRLRTLADSVIRQLGYIPAP